MVGLVGERALMSPPRCLALLFIRYMHDLSRYDPIRKMRLTYWETLKNGGWPYKKDDNITEGVSVLASLSDKYVAYEV